MLRITIMNRAFCCAVIFIVFFVQGYACRAADARWDSDSVSAGRVGEDPNAWVQACSPFESNQTEVQISAPSSDFLVSISGSAPFLARWVLTDAELIQIGRGSGRGRVWQVVGIPGVAVELKEKNN